MLGRSATQSQAWRSLETYPDDKYLPSFLLRGEIQGAVFHAQLATLPVLQCRQCGETELEQATMSPVDQLLAAVDVSAELEVIRYAA